MVLDKTVYAVGEEAKIAISLTNRADYALKGIIATCEAAGGDHFGQEPMVDSWADLRPYSAGVTLNARETKTLVVTEKVPEAARWKNRGIASCPSHRAPHVTATWRRRTTGPAFPVRQAARSHTTGTATSRSTPARASPTPELC
ncbi:hypothetical protein GCM10010178_13050 [Lentzea flava]|uniref:Uncharacterized protein n=2 Tax=Lentzea flava TaxID=103732 RepID=A0ABQ2UFA7_9PSEU|nr:hypothetical protein GCM10010178_13050 [Lentzea flava]